LEFEVGGYDKLLNYLKTILKLTMLNENLEFWSGSSEPWKPLFCRMNGPIAHAVLKRTVTQGFTWNQSDKNQRLVKVIFWTVLSFFPHYALQVISPIELQLTRHWRVLNSWTNLLIKTEHTSRHYESQTTLDMWHWVEFYFSSSYFESPKKECNANFGSFLNFRHSFLHFIKTWIRSSESKSYCHINGVNSKLERN